MTVLNDTNPHNSGHGHDHSKVIDIGDGLIMRWSTKADTDNVVQLIGDSFRWLPLGDPLPEDEIPGPSELLKAGARRLLSGKTAAMSEYDFALVEDTTNKAKGLNPIVACVSLHQVPAYYGSINLVFGKSELVATEPSYRNKGLIRRLMHEMIHPASEARGHALQFIFGIPYFYRQFGYEYGLSPLPGSKIDSLTDIPPLSPTKQGEPYPLRLATQTDIPFLTRLSQTPHQYLQPREVAVGTRYTPEYWQYAVHDSILDRQSRFDADRQTFVITDGEGKAVGFVSMSHIFFGTTVEAFALDEAEGVYYVDVAYSALRQLFGFAKERQAQNTKAFEDFKKSAAKAKTNQTPASATEEAQAAAATLEPNASLRASTSPASAYPLFLKTVRPELELRLAQNPAIKGTSCRLRLDFFRKVEGNAAKGLEIVIEKGQLVKIHDWAKPSPEDLFNEKQAWKSDEKNGGKAPTVYYATFSPLTFTQLVTGKQSLEELIWSYGENSVREDAARLILNTLFPKVEHSMDLFDW
ncbi:hypothetical protein BG015_003893 [Linnemannia schmuckeri]|uniref:Uncharacterized protein n=1 Tax=Linnemannia schmuckeri TaxID=64567 RepID=A0A9P5VCZ6_9FUNG|nr:hypothetical protein BG015_003893 [Linnemannia schmuckeri]